MSVHMSPLEVQDVSHSPKVLFYPLALIALPREVVSYLSQLVPHLHSFRLRNASISVLRANRSPSMKIVSQITSIMHRGRFYPSCISVRRERRQGCTILDWRVAVCLCFRLIFTLWDLVLQGPFCLGGSIPVPFYAFFPMNFLIGSARLSQYCLRFPPRQQLDAHWHSLRPQGLHGVPH